MRKGTKWAGLLIAWASLFGITYIVLSKQGADDASASIAADPEAEAQTVFESLLRLPTTSKTAELVDLEDAAPAFSSGLNKQLFEQKSIFKPCKSAAMARSTRKTEYFEVSFSLAETPLASSVLATPAPRDFEVTDIRLERSTMQLTPDELECVIVGFEAIEVRLEVGEDDVPAGRIRFVFCFTNRETAG